MSAPTVGVVCAADGARIRTATQRVIAKMNELRIRVRYANDAELRQADEIHLDVDHFATDSLGTSVREA